MSGLFVKKRVLLIESKHGKSTQIRSLLEEISVELCIASNIQDAVSQMMRCAFDVVALDAKIEEAFRLIKPLLDLRHARNTLLLFFNVDEANARTSFLNQGFDMCLLADDPEECSAAIRALLRRLDVHEYPNGDTPPGHILYKELSIDPLRLKVTIRDREVSLTAMEFRLLYFLASNPTIVFSRDYIYERVWRETSIYGSKSVTDLVCSIRKKLGLTAKDSGYIKTVTGIGYCFGV